MAARTWVVKWFGEGVARKIEQFVDGLVFQDEFVTCGHCSTPVAAALITERGECPICRTATSSETIIELLEVRRRAALAAGDAANNEVKEIDQKLLSLRKER